MKDIQPYKGDIKKGFEWYARAQDDYLHSCWTPEFYEAVDKAVKRNRISLLQVLMDMQAVAYKEREKVRR